MVAILAAYVQTNCPEVVCDNSPSYFGATLPDGRAIILSADSLDRRNSRSGIEQTIFLSFSPEAILSVKDHAECTFDLKSRKLYGRSSEVSEALRAVFFSVGVRFSYCGYRRKDLNYQELIDSGIE